MDTKVFNNIIVWTSVTAVLFFSYLPFVYLFSSLGIVKTIGFQVLTAAALGMVVFKITWRYSVDYNRFLVLLLYGLFASYALLNFSCSANFLNDTYNIRTVTLINTIFVTLSLVCSRYKKSLLAVLYLMTSSYIVFALFAVLTGGFSFGPEGTQVVFQDPDSNNRFYQNINMYIGIFIILSFSYFHGHFTKRPVKWLIVVTTLFSCAMMLAIGGRASVVGLIIVFCIYLFYRPKANLFSVGTITSLALLFTGTLVALIVFQDELGLFFENFLTYRRFLVLTEDNDSSQRIYLFSRAIELFLLNWKTVLFGAGMNSFPMYTERFSTGWYPHNVLLELLAEYGLIGFLLFQAPVIVTLYLRKKLLGSIWGNTRQETAVILLTVYFWSMFSFTGGLRHTWTLVFFTYLAFPSSTRSV